MAFFAPLDDHDDILEPERLLAQVAEAAPAASEPDPVIVDTLSPPLPPVAATSPATDPLAPPAPQPRGWQPAFVADDKRKRNLSE
jgi:hypothetical protein